MKIRAILNNWKMYDQSEAGFPLKNRAKQEENMPF